MGFLSRVVAEVRRELDRHPLDEGRLLARVLASPPSRDFAAAIRTGQPAIIAEVKRSSPTAGPIADRDPGDLAARYEAGGAAAVSVLTEGRHFGGSLADLRAVRVRVGLPVLRKDFLVHPSQLIEARAEGADAVLLIVACLPDGELEAMVSVAGDLGLAALVEAHDEEDLARAIAVDARIVGVNARDLESLEVDADRALALTRTVPPDRAVVVESGISTREQVERAADAGAAAVLVGEALMRSADPEATLRELRGESG